ncbi:hypothetical protein lotta82_gp029 [Flavobacterium phage vB_FspM_lotta8-2]|uniref:Uncharacterized protein n=1 Tax=Flavobacterium phage vB_FspM_lotta8-2 TaxID=2686243 RepID=A0A6B9L9K0_9CAUD|nr:hypothetical protein lotta82_gp029 [Flavobacterium phage vB_FspM_lotta8-2]
MNTLRKNKRNMEAKKLICFNCKHFNEIQGGCAAFPEGIPDEITEGNNQHEKPLKGQENDIIFEPAD